MQSNPDSSYASKTLVFASDAERQFDLHDIEHILADSINGAIDVMEKNAETKDLEKTRFQRHRVVGEIHVVNQCLTHENKGNLLLGQVSADLASVKALLSFATSLLRRTIPQYNDPYAIQRINSPEQSKLAFGMRSAKMNERLANLRTLYCDCDRTHGHSHSHSRNDSDDVNEHPVSLYPSSTDASKWCLDREFLMDQVYLTLDQCSSSRGSNSFVTMDLFGMGMIVFRYLVPGTTYVVAGHQTMVDHRGELTINASALENSEVVEIDRKIKEIKDRIEGLTDQLKDLETQKAKLTKKAT